MIVVAAVLAAIAGTAAPPATLCIDAKCRAVGEAELSVVPANAVRSFVWTTADSLRSVVGTVPPHASHVDLADDVGVTHKFTLGTSDGAREVGARLEIRCAENSWKWSMLRAPRQPMEITRPAGGCKLLVQADGYRRVETELASTRLGVLYLHRLPVISGAVVDAVTREPVSAQVLLPGGEVLSATGDRGRFRAVIDGPWPAKLQVEAPGYPAHTITIPRAVADVDLPIVLSRGGAIRVTVAPPLGQERLQWEARRVIRDVDDERARSGDLAAGESTAAIGPLQPGDYRVVIMGEGPLQRFALPVTVIEGTTHAVTVQITPSRLDLTVVRGGAPIPGATVEFVFRDGRAAWRSKVTVDESGRAAEEIWQSGDYMASVASFAQRRGLAGGETVSWNLAVPERVVEGGVVDAATGRPLGNVAVVLTTTASSGGHSTTMTRTTAEGLFVFESVPSGSYSVTARLDGYHEITMPVRPLADEIRVDTGELRLQPVTGHILRVMNAVGMPMVSALVCISTRSGVRIAGLTRADGRVTLPLADNEYGDSYVLPRSGSFAVASFPSIAERGVEELVVTVPDGGASLEIHTVTAKGEPLPSVPFLVRVNGRLIPPEILERMAHFQGVPMFSDKAGRLLLSRLPPGRYEIWPLGSREDFVAVNSLTPPPAAINLSLVAGNYVAKLTFKPKK